MGFVSDAPNVEDRVDLLLPCRATPVIRLPVDNSWFFPDIQVSTLRDDTCLGPEFSCDLVPCARRLSLTTHHSTEEPAHTESAGRQEAL
jgi:hypothetical protein